VTEREDKGKTGENEIVIEKGRLVGCHGRVLIVFLVLLILIALLLVMLLRGMFAETQPMPVPRASADSVGPDLARGDSAGTI
jgi:hypothetical protein